MSSLQSRLCAIGSNCSDRRIENSSSSFLVGCTALWTSSEIGQDFPSKQLRRKILANLRTSPEGGAPHQERGAAVFNSPIAAVAPDRAQSRLQARHTRTIEPALCLGQGSKRKEEGSNGPRRKRRTRREQRLSWSKLACLLS